ncbi:MAG: ribonuclease D [Pseudomonadota bacterium]
MKTEYITTKQQLNEICTQFKDSNYLIIDTEFIRQTTYYPILALLQVYDGKTIALIDPVAIDDLSPLFDICFDPDIVKVLHSARQDMEIFYHICGKLPTPIFDTQIAAALLGHGSQIGYAALTKAILGVELDKSQTRTNWLKRPLTKKQLNYASNDVLYLEQIYKIQKQQLQEQQRLSWLENDFNFLTEQETYQVDKLNLWKKIRGFNRLKQDQLVVLQYLVAWREEIAIEKNITRKKVIHDDFLLEIAIQKPKKNSDLSNFQCLSERLVQHHGKTIINLVNQALDSPLQNWPTQPKRIQLTQQQDALADCLMAINHLCADNNNISPNCLCNRKELEKLVLGKRSLGILSGWRFELAGKQLLSFLNGGNSLSVLHNQLSLQHSTQ